MRVSLAVLGLCALAHAVPTAEINVIDRRTSIPDVFSSHKINGAFVELLKDVADIVKHFTGKANKPIPSKTTFKDWKTFKANGVNLGGWLRK
jgi:hypothetical protein